jgi:hypothetical protein
VLTSSLLRSSWVLFILSLSENHAFPLQLPSLRRSPLPGNMFPIRCGLTFLRHSLSFSLYMLLLCPSRSVSVWCLLCSPLSIYSMALDLLCNALGSIHFPLQFIDTPKCRRGYSPTFLGVRNIWVHFYMDSSRVLAPHCDPFSPLPRLNQISVHSENTYDAEKIPVIRHRNSS